jgi:hypothetical protein
MNGRNTRRQRSGQILIIAVLVISLMLLSTTLYIYEVGRPSEAASKARITDFVLAVKQGSQHVVLGSLANISTGGAESILWTNLKRWKTFIERSYELGRPVLRFSLTNTSLYNNGLYLLWGNAGFAVSSASTAFTLSLTDHEVNAQVPYSVNVTTALTIEGHWRTIEGEMKQVNITLNLANEDGPALAKDITLLYESQGTWPAVDHRSRDYGNGTYTLFFETDTPGDGLNVSAHIHDLRGIHVQANATCPEVE